MFFFVSLTEAIYKGFMFGFGLFVFVFSSLWPFPLVFLLELYAWTVLEVDLTTCLSVVICK